MTDAERAVWRLLRDRRLAAGWRFRRQEPIDRYIVDFVCFEARLVIEVDGGQHSESETDKVRDAYLQSQEFRVLRFWEQRRSCKSRRRLSDNHDSACALHA